MTEALLEATIAEIHAGIEGGDWTARSIVQTYLDRIDAYDSDLNSILTVNPAALTRAEHLDHAFQDRGFTGPLHGIPVIVKDNHDTHDLPTTFGSVAFSESIPTRDATVVRKLREAGGILLAKSNLQELSYGVDTISSAGGPTWNPYALDRRPSGSSGGTAAAIAANLAAVGTGTDTCSSVRSPAAFTNLVGLRPTQGLVSRAGIAPLSGTQDTVGPMTRSVADAARLLDVLIGADPRDPTTSEIPGGVTTTFEAPIRGSLKGARIGVVRDWFGLQEPSSDLEASAVAVTDILDQAITSMRAAGATIIDPVELPDLGFIQSARVIRYEFERDFDRYLRRRDGEIPIGSLADLIASGTLADPVEDRLQSTELLEIDVDRLSDHPPYLRRLNRRKTIRRNVIARMNDQRLDALVYPPSTILPVKRPATQPFSELHCELAAHTGCPAIVVPAGFTNTDIPVGVELFGRPFSEGHLLALAAGIEQAIDGRRPPSEFPPL